MVRRQSHYGAATPTYGAKLTRTNSSISETGKSGGGDAHTGLPMSMAVRNSVHSTSLSASTVSTGTSNSRRRSLRGGSSASLGRKLKRGDTETGSVAVGSTTFADLFLADKSDDEFQEDASKRPLIPLPPSFIALMRDRQIQSEHLRSDADYIESLVQKKDAARQESKLQKYWTSFATFHDEWPELEMARERVQNFITLMTAEIKEGLNRYCGERPKCSAFVVVCSDPIALRKVPSTSSEDALEDLIYPGQIILSEARLFCNKIQYIKLRGGGWTFETKGPIRCMSYVVNMELGPWWYRVVSREYAEVRVAPNFSKHSGSGFMLCPGEVCVIAVRCMVDDRCWLQLADGRGWIFERRPPNAPKVEAEVQQTKSQAILISQTKLISDTGDDVAEVVMAECAYEIDEFPLGMRQDDPTDTVKAGAVEVGFWEYEVKETMPTIGASVSGFVLRAGERVAVDLRVPANGRRESLISTKPTAENRIWLRLSDGRGWVPKTSLDGVLLLKFVRMVTPGSGNVVQKAFAVDTDQPPADLSWMKGVA